MINAITKRRAVREYLAEPISEENLNEIIMAAMHAPSANALYPWELIVIEKAETKEALSKVTPWAVAAKNAATVIVMVGHKVDSPQWIEDCAVAAEHLWLAATELQLGACWVQIRGNVNAEKQVKELLGVPEEHRVLCLVTLGKPVKSEPEHTAEEFDKSKVRYEKY